MCLMRRYGITKYFSDDQESYSLCHYLDGIKHALCNKGQDWSKLWGHMHNNMVVVEMH